MRYGDTPRLTALELAELCKLMRRWVLESYPLDNDGGSESSDARQTYISIYRDADRRGVRPYAIWRNGADFTVTRNNTPDNELLDLP